MKALNGCRVLDLGIITAGAATSAVLADLGAEVIKIESPSYKDPFRQWSGEAHSGEDADLPPFFRMTNRSKRNLAIDLKTERGRALFLDLVAKSDVVVENFSRGVLARLGIDFAALTRANPAIILASISSQGEDGPDARYVSFGSTLEAMAGLASLTGYAGDDRPVLSGIEMNYPDQVVAIFAASMIVTAWVARRKGAAGVHLDLSQRDLTTFLCGEAFVSGEVVRRGNGQPGIAVQECFRAGDGRWVAVSVAEATSDTADALAATIAACPADEAVAVLRARGLVAAVVLDGVGVLGERGHGWTRALLPLDSGDLVKGFLFEDAEDPMVLGEAAARLGAHTHAVLREVGGLDDAVIDALVVAGVVAIDPEGAP